MPKPPPGNPADHAGPAPVRARILRQARADFFAHGYNRFTMADLATELGMSKKTLYIHFSGKDEIIAAVIQDLGEEVRRDAEAILRDGALTFAEKLRGFVLGMMKRLATLEPRTVRDLQRYAPELFARIEDVRRKNIPYIFGRLVAEGQAAGMVRTDVPAPFAIEFFLNAMQGLLQGAALERLRLAPGDIVAQGIDLFFGGLLTPAGHKQYEKSFPR
jgi:AcrR family transcriptional regulator